jgi:hypothetical protein
VYKKVAQYIALDTKKQEKEKLTEIFSPFYKTFYRESKEEHYCGKEFYSPNPNQKIKGNHLSYSVFVCYDCAV